jgi:hypothetical protein
VIRAIACSRMKTRIRRRKANTKDGALKEQKSPPNDWSCDVRNMSMWQMYRMPPRIYLRIRRRPRSVGRMAKKGKSNGKRP